MRIYTTPVTTRTWDLNGIPEEVVGAVVLMVQHYMRLADGALTPETTHHPYGGGPWCNDDDRRDVWAEFVLPLVAQRPSWSIHEQPGEPRGEVKA